MTASMISLSISAGYLATKKLQEVNATNQETIQCVTFSFTSDFVIVGPNQAHCFPFIPVVVLS